MADVSLPGDTGAFMQMDYEMEDARAVRSGDEPTASRQEGAASLRKMRSQQSKAKKKARETAKAAKKQVMSAVMPVVKCRSHVRYLL